MNLLQFLQRSCGKKLRVSNWFGFFIRSDRSRWCKRHLFHRFVGSWSGFRSVVRSRFANSSFGGLLISRIRSWGLVRSFRRLVNQQRIHVRRKHFRSAGSAVFRCGFDRLTFHWSVNRFKRRIIEFRRFKVGFVFDGSVLWSRWFVRRLRGPRNVIRPEWLVDPLQFLVNGFDGHVNRNWPWIGFPFSGSDTDSKWHSLDWFI